MTFRGPFITALALCGVRACLGQVQPSQSPSIPPPQLNGGGAGGFSKVIDGVTHTFSFRTTNAPPVPAHVVFTGAPYSGEEVEENVRTLPDGSRLTRKTLNSRTYRDSVGRLRMERAFPPGVDPESHPAAAAIDILDPVANVVYRLETRARIALRWDLSRVPGPDTMSLAPLGISTGEGLPPSLPPRSMPAANNRPAPPAGPPPGGPPPGLPRPAGAAAAPPNMPAMKSESLGTQVIDGITVEGVRTTHTNPPGMEGSGAVIVSEQWTAPELRLTLLQKTSDPRLGETTRRIIHLSRAEPDISLFQPPADYQVVDERVSITINHQVRQ